MNVPTRMQVPQPTISQQADVITRSKLFSDIRDKEQAAVKIMAGKELGFDAVTAMSGIHIIKGKITLGATLLAAAIKRSKRYDYRVVETTDDRCEIQFFELGQECGRAVFTMEDAKRADLTSNQQWKKHPSDMLFARALTRGQRRFCPDVINGTPAYTPEELGHYEEQPQRVRTEIVADPEIDIEIPVATDTDDTTVLEGVNF